MRRFFMGKPISDMVSITGQDAVHIACVLRLEPGERIEVVDSLGQVYEVLLQQVTKAEVVGEVIAKHSKNSEPQTEIHLVQAIGKGDKMDFVVQKCTELGVTSIIPIVTERTVVKVELDKAKAKQQRWQKIANEAAKQSKRNKIPEIQPIMPVAKALNDQPRDGLGILLHVDASSTLFRETLSKCSGQQPIYLYIGPEGGFDPKEVQLARDNGIHTVGLGSRVLRTETAGLAALAILLFHFGDLG